MACTQDLENGKYRIIISNGFLANGKQNRITKTISAKSRKQAEKIAAEMEVDFRRNIISPVSNAPSQSELCFKDLVEKWQSLIAPNLAISTRERYESFLSKDIAPYFNNFKLSNIKPINISEYLAHIESTRHLSPKTIKEHFILINRLFNLACNWEFMENNPCAKVRKPKSPEPIIDFYNTDQMQALFNALDIEDQELEELINHSVKYDRYYTPEKVNKSIAVRRYKALQFRVFIVLAFVTGLRREEALGLERSDLDFKNNQIQIVRTSQYSPKIGLYSKKMLKNGDPIRILPMPQEAMNQLSTLLKKQDECRALMGDEWVYSDRLFIAIKGGVHTKAGGPIMPDNITQSFSRFQKKHNLPHLKLHGLRHSAASYMISNNINLLAVANRLGHKDLKMTMHYAHLFESTKREAADVFSGILG